MLKQCKENNLVNVVTSSQTIHHRFDDVQLQVRNNRKLNIMMGDLEVHFAVTRTKNRHGQHFLGFYVEEQNVLSPLTTGIIGGLNLLLT